MIILSLSFKYQLITLEERKSILTFSHLRSLSFAESKNPPKKSYVFIAWATNCPLSDDKSIVENYFDISLHQMSSHNLSKEHCHLKNNIQYKTMISIAKMLVNPKFYKWNIQKIKIKRCSV